MLSTINCLTINNMIMIQKEENYQSIYSTDVALINVEGLFGHRNIN